jgi:hypothetical protein
VKNGPNGAPAAGICAMADKAEDVERFDRDVARWIPFGITEPKFLDLIVHDYGLQPSWHEPAEASGIVTAA